MFGGGDENDTTTETDGRFESPNATEVVNVEKESSEEATKNTDTANIHE